VCAAEFIDRLLPIADDDEGRSRDRRRSRASRTGRSRSLGGPFREPPEQLELGAARVLELVHEEEPRASLLQRAHGRLAREQVSRETGEIVEIEAREARLLAPVAALGLVSEERELPGELARTHLRVCFQERVARIAHACAGVAC